MWSPADILQYWQCALYFVCHWMLTLHTPTPTHMHTIHTADFAVKSVQWSSSETVKLHVSVYLNPTHLTTFMAPVFFPFIFSPPQSTYIKSPFALIFPYHLSSPHLPSPSPLLTYLFSPYHLSSPHLPLYSPTSSLFITSPPPL